MSIRTAADIGSVRPVPLRAARGAFAACLLAVFLQMLDMTVVNTALPTLARDLAATGSAQLFVVTGYSLAFACALPTATRLGDIHGRRTLFLASMAGFIMASIWCGCCEQSTALIGGRMVQGIAAAGMAAQTVAIVNASFAPDRRALAFGIYGAVAGSAGLAGPLVGGAIVATDPLGLGWHAIFLLNAPVGVLALILAYRGLHIGASPTSTRADIPGVLLASVGLLLVLYPVTVGRERGWPAAILVMLGVGCLVLVVFGWQQYRAEGTGLLRGAIFTDRTFAVGAIAMLVFYGVFTAFLFTVSATMQSGIGLSAWQTATFMTPFALGAIPAAATAPLLVARLGSRTLTVGILVFAVSAAVIASLLHHSSAGVEARVLAAPICLAGIGIGWFAAALPALMTARVTDSEVGSASGLLPTIQQLGSAFGAAALGTVFFARISDGDGIAAGESAFARALMERGIPLERTLAEVGRFDTCAHAALASPTPMVDGSTCPATIPDVGIDAAAVTMAQTYIAALSTLMSIMAAIAFALGMLTLLMPRDAGSRA
ncbi:MFS transporter [Nocardia sp. NPDC056000]|uniref:MFS transporter n=1 Tax=Nocardia sp. NPDC056000 TaxID=3345674 RepID=UPI0035E05E3D